jgi:thioredoxin 1
MASANVKEFTDENFETEVLKSDQVVLVDFWAEWCPPCRALTPTIEKLADAYQGRVKIGKVNTDSSREVVMKYRISSIPTVLLFKGGEVVQTLPGLRKEDVYREALDSIK